MKKITIFLLALAFILSVSGCGVTEKVQEKAAEKATEKAIENATGGNAKVDINGDKYKVDYGDDNSLEIGGGKWPTGDSADIIPKFDKGKISSVINTKEGCIIDIDEVEKNDFDSYLQTVKNAGFTKDTTNMNSDSNSVYMATAGNGKSIILSYTPEEKHLQISGALEK